MTEVFMIKELGAFYWRITENYLDLVKIIAGVAFLLSPEFMPNVYKLHHFNNEDFYEDWNLVDINCLSFGVLMVIQWTTISNQLQQWKAMRIINSVIENSFRAVLASAILLFCALAAVQDFFYFKRYLISGNQLPYEYPKVATKNFRMYLFGDFDDRIDDFDSIDMLVFAGFTFWTLILLTNTLIAYMGDAYARVQATMEICQGQGTAELLMELETIYGMINFCVLWQVKKNERFIMSADYEKVEDD